MSAHFVDENAEDHSTALEALLQPAHDVNAPSQRASLHSAIRLGAWLESQLTERCDEAGLSSNTEGSLRALVRDMNGALSLSKAYRALRIYRLSLRYRELTTCKHLGVAHVSVVLFAPNEEQVRLLRWAEARKCSRRKLEVIVSSLRLAKANPKGSLRKVGGYRVGSDAFENDQAATG